MSSPKFQEIAGSGKIRVTTRADVKAARASALESASGFEPDPQGSLLDAFFGSGSQAGKTITFERALRLAAVYSCIRILSDTIGSMPICVYSEDAGGNRDRAKDSWQWELLHDRPNREMTPATVWGSTMTYLNTDGNAFLGKEFSMLVPNRVIGLWPMRPERIRLARDRNGAKLFYLRDDVGREEPKPYTSGEILHVLGLTYNGFRGISPLSAAREAIGAGLALEEHMNRFWPNSAMPGGVLTTDKVISSQAEAKLRARWNKMHRGPRNAARIAVLEDGVTFEAVSINQKDAQFVEQHALAVGQIARYFRVPMSMIGAESPNASLTYRTVEGDNLHFLTHSIRPWNVRIEQALLNDDDLFPLRPEGDEQLYPEFLADALLRSDTLTRYKALQIAVANKAWMLPSEVRRLENLPADEGLDALPAPEPAAGALASTNGNAEADGQPAAAGASDVR